MLSTIALHRFLLPLSFFSPSLSILIVVHRAKNLCPTRGWHHFYSSRKIKACPIASPDNHEYFIRIISRRAPPPHVHTYAGTRVPISLSPFFLHPFKPSCDSSSIQPSCPPTRSPHQCPMAKMKNNSFQRVPSAMGINPIRIRTITRVIN